MEIKKETKEKKMWKSFKTLTNLNSAMKTPLNI